MSSVTFRFLGSLMVVFTLTFSGVARADMRDFLLTCAYGAGIGALAGTTVLAFSDKPGENLNSIARGASLGLYAGMAIGAYNFTSQEVSISGETAKAQWWISPSTYAVNGPSTGATIYYQFRY